MKGRRNTAHPSTTTTSRFVPVEQLGICSPIGYKHPLDKPEPTKKELMEIEGQILPVFDHSKAMNGATTRSLAGLIGDANTSWHLNKHNVDPLID